MERQVTVEDENNSPRIITVSILEDEDDGDISEGDLSLREAIATAVEIVNSSIADNNSASSSGGLDVRDSQVTISNSAIADNFGVGGGGIDSVSSNVNVNRTVISGNRTSSFGGSGAIDSDADSVLTIDRSFIDGNTGIDPFNPTPPEAVKLLLQE